MNNKPQKMNTLVRILKDKVSILKTTLSLSSKPTSSFHAAILRATTLHHPSDPPPLDAVLALSQRPSSGGALIHALLHRLHGTRSAYVALKCLLTLHHVINNGSPVLKEHILCYSNGPLFNLATFKDESNRDTSELSAWVRWYGDVLDYGISLRKCGGERMMRLSSLVGMVVKICGAPESLHYQKLSLVYEIIKNIGEDYRLIMREVNSQLITISRKIIQELSDEKLKELLGDLKRIESCKEKLLLMFLNKKKNDGVWELIEEVRRDVEEVKQRKENMRMVKFQGTESTQSDGKRVGESRSLAVVPAPRVKRWLDVEWNPLVASFA